MKSGSGAIVDQNHADQRFTRGSAVVQAYARLLGSKPLGVQCRLLAVRLGWSLGDAGRNLKKAFSLGGKASNLMPMAAVDLF